MLRRAPLACACVLVAAAWAGERVPMFELVVHGGRVMDPETGLDAVRDVGIANGRIAAVSERPLTGDTSIDARGLVVAPGFIDLHVHGADVESDALRAADGVTTALELEIGTGDVDAFYAAREGRSLVNFGASVGHVPVRMAVMGDAPGFLPAATSRAAAAASSVDDLAAITRGIRDGLAKGALAVGMGLQYTQAASRWEVVEVFREAARAGASVHVHLRYGGMKEPNSSTNALEEVLAAAAATGAALHVVHLPSTSLGFTERHLSMIAGARERGLDVTTECYPYLAGMTDIASGVFDEGWREAAGIDYGDLMWAATGERLTAETFAAHRKTGGMVAVFSIPESAMLATLAAPGTIVASDGLIHDGKGHPRTAGTNARLLGLYVREQKRLALMDALARLTLLPARRLERRAPVFARKGRVQVGADADLTVFDPATIADRATFAAPTLRPAGIAAVIVNGVPIVENGKRKAGVWPGRGMRAALR